MREPSIVCTPWRIGLARKYSHVVYLYFSAAVWSASKFLTRHAIIQIEKASMFRGKDQDEIDSHQSLVEHAQ